jgi:hypothetical protein
VLESGLALPRGITYFSYIHVVGLAFGAPAPGPNPPQPPFALQGCPQVISDGLGSAPSTGRPAPQHRMIVGPERLRCRFALFDRRTLVSQHAAKKCNWIRFVQKLDE